MILIGDARQKLKEIPDETIDCVVTSPPYWGLRDYGHDGQIGLENDYQTYIQELVTIFQEIRRTLKPTGTLWLNLGDTYNGSGGNHQPHHKNDTGFQGKIGAEHYKGKGRNIRTLKPKDLIGIPWRVALALQKDGWWLRQDIIWSKPNPIPEPVTDRCTKAHEYIFLLTKNRDYYYNHHAIEEQAKTTPGATWQQRKAAGATAGNVIIGHETRNGTQRVVHGKGVTSNLTRQDGKRNKRSVWEINTKPYKGAHFATYPTELVEPCILAGCPPNGTVLDPFLGAGTTALVAQQHNRNWIGIELNPEYAEIAQNRITENQNLFTQHNSPQLH